MNDTKYIVYAKRKTPNKYTEWGRYKNVEDAENQAKIINSRNWLAKIFNIVTKEVIRDDDML